MVTKADLEQLTMPMLDLYNNIEHDMLVNIASNLRGKTKLLEDDPVKWKLQQMQKLGMLDKDNIQIIKAQTGFLSGQLNQILMSAGLEGVEETDEALKKATKKNAKVIIPPAIAHSPAILNIIKGYQNQARSYLNLTNQTMISSAKQAYINVINKSVLDVTSGTKTADQALRSTIRQWAEYGIPALIDKGGKKWGPEGYVRTVLTSTANNTVHALQDERMSQWNVDLVEVSSHSGARPLCAPYQGKIYSLSGSSKKYPKLSSTSMGKPAGLFGINCGHKKYPFIDGASTQRYFPHDEKENERVYHESQIQRAHERGIRKAKTRHEMYKAMGDEKGMKESLELIKSRQGSLRSFIKETGRTRRRDREQTILGTEKTPTYPTPKPKSDPTPKVKTPKTTPKPKDPPTPTVKPDPPKQKQNKITAPKKVTKDLVKGDKIQFTDLSGNELKGEISSKYTSGKMVIKDMDGKLHKIDQGNVIAHIPEVKQMVNLTSFVRIDPTNNHDVVRDGKALTSMKSSESFYVRKYTSNYYSNMNSFLRFGQGVDDDDLKRTVSNLQRVLKENTQPLRQDTLLFRQINVGSAGKIFGPEIGTLLRKVGNGNTEVIDEIKKRLIGGAMEDKGFVSSTYKEGAFGGSDDIKIMIHAPKGYKNGMFVEAVSEFSHEKEYIFNSGMKFDIHDVVIERGQIILKVIPN